MDARAVLSARRGRGRHRGHGGPPPRKTPTSHTSFPARRVSGSWTKHARSHGSAATRPGALRGGARRPRAITRRHRRRASVAGGSAEPPSPRSRRDRRTDARATARHATRRLAPVGRRRPVARRDRQIQSPGARQKCDAETLAPLCASARDDDRSISRRDAERLIEKERRRQKKEGSQASEERQRRRRRKSGDERSRDSRSSEALARLAEVAAGRIPGDSKTTKKT